MGAYYFSIDRFLVESLRSSLGARIYIETGTYQGDSIAAVIDLFDQIHSVELSEKYAKAATERFASAKNVRVHQGESSSVLENISASFKAESVIFFLDAHWCDVTESAGLDAQCPLVAELAAIAELGSSSAIIIDDARLFCAPPPGLHQASQWPSFSALLKSISDIAPNHQLTIVNDCIVVYPAGAAESVNAYCQNRGGDLLKIMHEYKTWSVELLKRETMLTEKEAALAKMGELLANNQAELVAKERVILELSGAVATYRRLLWFFWPIVAAISLFSRHARAMLYPRLGNLNQYPAKAKVVFENTDLRLSKLSKTPSISIVTPSYQQGVFIERTIRSVIAQNYPNLEYFVEDGGSTDSTVKVLKQYEEKLSGWVSEKDAGQAMAINRGFARTNGEIMGWLNSDDILLPGALFSIAEYFNRHPEVDVVYGNRLLIDESDRDIGRWILPGHDSSVLSWVDYIPQETLFWRRGIWEKVGGKVDESFQFAMDWDLLLRFRDAGAKFGHKPKFLGAFRVHDHQKTAVAINDVGYKEMNRVRLRSLGRIPDEQEIRLALLPYLVKHVAVDFAFRIKKIFG